MCDLKFLRSEILRTTVSQEVQCILGAGAAGQQRKVQILVPPSPQVFAGLDVAAEDVGMNKTFNMPVIHAGQLVEFPLGCAQALYAACAEGFALVTLIIEHYEVGS